MNSAYTHIAIILDRSGSMQSIRSDVVGGFNSFLKEQKEVDGKCTVTLVQFDSQDPYEVLRDFVPIRDVATLGDEYTPRASTPLYDAVGRGIVDTGSRLARMAEADRPGQVVFVILTDGLENASQEFNRERVLAMIREQTDKYAWQFVYLGANQDAMVEGEKIGVCQANAMTYSPGKAGAMMRELSQNVGEYRKAKAKDMRWSERQRDEVK